MGQNHEWGRGMSVLVGLPVRLERTTDRIRPCHDNLAVIVEGTGPHPYGMRCGNCQRHRGWVPKAAIEFLTKLVALYGVPAQPISIRDATKDSSMAYDNTNSGALFKNDDKQGDKSPDYKGTLNVDGVEFWLNAWIKTSKKGTKFMSLSAKPKAEKVERSRSVREELNDEIPF
jgi:hypothetical protein